MPSKEKKIKRPTEKTGVEKTTAPSLAEASLPAAQNETIRFVLYRIVVAGLIVSLLWKVRGIPMFYGIYRAIPLDDPFFPAGMRSHHVLAVAFVLPIVLGVVSFFVRRRWFLVFQAGVTLVCMFVLCGHQATYNDATFVTCFWTSGWLLWYASRINDRADELIDKAQRLGLLVFSMIFLGGFVGKLTPEYWSGDVLYQIYFVDRDFWFFNLLRSRYDDETLRQIATWYSRFVVVVEGLGCGLWLLPVRWGALLGMLIFLAIALLSNFYLFSVTGCLLALGVVGLVRVPVSPSSNRGRCQN